MFSLKVPIQKSKQIKHVSGKGQSAREELASVCGPTHVHSRLLPSWKNKAQKQPRKIYKNNKK